MKITIGMQNSIHLDLHREDEYILHELAKTQICIGMLYWTPDNYSYWRYIQNMYGKTKIIL